VAAGGSVIDPLVVEAMLRRRSKGNGSVLGRLTPREREVLEQMATGRSNPAIGEQLFLSVSAVEKNITAIFAKLRLTEERMHHRRVAAVLAFLGER
jgi:DNA-binding NarL/FixJ family response regulator